MLCVGSLSALLSFLDAMQRANNSISVESLDEFEELYECSGVRQITNK